MEGRGGACPSRRNLQNPMDVVRHNHKNGLRNCVKTRKTLGKGVPHIRNNFSNRG